MRLVILVEPEAVLAIPDSGIFQLYENYQTHTNFLQNMVVNLWKLANIDEQTPIQECNLKYPQEAWRCLFFEFAHPFLRARTLVINSQYDAFSLGVSLAMPCLSEGKECMTLKLCTPEQIQYIEGYRSRCN